MLHVTGILWLQLLTLQSESWNKLDATNSIQILSDGKREWLSDWENDWGVIDKVIEVSYAITQN